MARDGGSRMIDYPEDQQLREQASRHDLQAPVLIRDIVRVVEVLNLRAQRFFNKRSVLSGSMALRCFGSPRFTVYDADFSTSAETVDPPASMTDMLRYSDEDLDIIPAEAVSADRRETLIQIEPIRFDAAFTSIVLADQDQQFKADVSFRGLLLDGREVPFEPPTRWRSGARRQPSGSWTPWRCSPRRSSAGAYTVSSSTTPTPPGSPSQYRPRLTTRVHLPTPP